MGCSSSKEEAIEPNRPVPLQSVVQGNQSQPIPSNSEAEAFGQVGGSRGYNNPMKSSVRREFLNTLHSAFHDVPYTVIGGSALAEYGSSRETADVDVLLSEGISKRSAESLLVRRTNGAFQRIGHGKIGFQTSRGDVFPLDLTVDTEVDMPFDIAQDTEFRGGARVANMIFLLNSKARAWQTRVPFEQNYQQKRENDARDIAFCLQMLQGHRSIDRRRLPWVYSRYFWVPFLTAYPYMDRLFQGADLWTDQTEFSSVASTRRSSRSNWSSRGSFANSTPANNSRNGSRTGSMR